MSFPRPGTVSHLFELAKTPNGEIVDLFGIEEVEQYDDAVVGADVLFEYSGLTITGKIATIGVNASYFNSTETFVAIVIEYEEMHYLRDFKEVIAL